MLVQVADGFAVLDAAAGGHTETVKYLLERKADPSKAWVSTGELL